MDIDANDLWGQRWRALLGTGVLPRFAVLCLGLWLHAASSMFAATTLPSAVEEIGGANLIGWAFSLYQLGSILAGAATGLVVARLGLRLSLLGAACLYWVGCVVCAVAPEMAVLLTGRLLQGIGGGWLVTLTYVAVNRLFAQELIPRLIALISAVWSVSALCGPLIGGTFPTYGLWRFAFWAFAGQTSVFLLAVFYLFVESGKDEDALPNTVPGIRLSVVAAAVLLVALAGTEFDKIISPALCVGSLALFWVFIWMDNTNPSSRMFPSRPHDMRYQVGAGLVLAFTASAATMSFLVYGPFLLEVLYGVTPLTAGYIVAFESVSWGIAAVIFSSAEKRSEKLLIRGGSTLITVGVVGFALMMPSGPLWAIWPWAACQGAGFGMMWGFVVRRVVAAAPDAERDLTSSAIPTTMQIGFAVGAAATGIVANAIGFGHEVSTLTAQSAGFWIFAAFLPLAFLANIAAWRLSADSWR